LDSESFSSLIAKKITLLGKANKTPSKEGLLSIIRLGNRVVSERQWVAQFSEGAPNIFMYVQPSATPDRMSQLE